MLNDVYFLELIEGASIIVQSLAMQKNVIPIAWFVNSRDEPITSAKLESGELTG